MKIRVACMSHLAVPTADSSCHAYGHASGASSRDAGGGAPSGVMPSFPKWCFVTATCSLLTRERRYGASHSTNMHVFVFLCCVIWVSVIANSSYPCSRCGSQSHMCNACVWLMREICFWHSPGWVAAQVFAACKNVGRFDCVSDIEP